MVVPARIVADLRLMRAKEILDLLDAHLLRLSRAVRELFRIRDVLTDQLLPREVVSRKVVARSAALCGRDGHAEVEVVVDPGNGWLVAAVLDRSLNHAGRHDDVFRISGVDVIHHEIVRDVDNLIVLHAASHPGVALMNGDLPGFLAVGDRVGAAFGEVTVLPEKIDRDVNGVAGARRALGHQAADAVADAAVLGRHDVVLVDARAGVRHDHDAVFIDEAVREGGAVRVEGLGPVEAEGVLHLWD